MASVLIRGLKITNAAEHPTHILRMLLRSSRELHAQSRTGTEELRLPETSVKQHIRIPKRTPRHQTSILEALSSTVKTDLTAPHYRYMDDPFLIPATVSNKRTYALAKDSGRKAARYMVQKYPEFFTKPSADPMSPALHASYLAGFQRPDKPTEEDLLARIRVNALVPAFEVYQDLKAKNVAITDETRQELLDRLCFHNGDNAEESDFPDEQWFVFYTQKDARRKWKHNGAAEKVFRDMETKTPAAYAAIICGMAKYLNAEGANIFFEEMEQLNFPMPVQVYNEMIKIIPYLCDSVEGRWELTLSMLSKMNEQNIRPTINTFNAVLDLLSRIAVWKRARPLALQVLAEMRRLGVTPSLATYHFVLQIFCRDRGPISHVLVDILRELKGKEFTTRDPKDTMFFVTAMEMATRHLQDPDIAKDVHSLLNEGHNAQFMVDAHKESNYYSSFFRALIAGESVENFFKFYDDLVPMTYTPDSTFILELLRMLEFHDQLQHIPRVWADAVTFALAIRESNVETFLEVMVNNYRSELTAQFATVAGNIRDRINAQPMDRAKKINWNGQIVGDVCVLLARNGETTAAWEVLNTYLNKRNELFGFPSQPALTELIDALVAAKEVANVKQCISLAADLGFIDITQQIPEIAEKLQLPKNQREEWQKLIGGSAIDLKENNTNEDVAKV